MCTCKSDNEKRLTDHVAKQLPEGAKNLSVRLTGYSLCITNGEMKALQTMPVEIEYDAPVKKSPGSFKPKKQKSFLAARYCMFCGEAYEQAEA
ncbi:hypothetical protein EAW52_10715 [Pseudomonas sp. LTJR-52]|uniref:hypothetical protein n=1 Tax=Pseudomonas sp. LTJR-52 TaxID=2479392 RepID=UPI000EFA38B4|nr:hypothetical protein [Pseudomonas sp. LTJR-52]AYN94397.1 hypothetical protein EAW52_10715 [Pseudomonas sp. LTJR-52]